MCVKVNYESIGKSADTTLILFATSCSKLHHKDRALVQTVDGAFAEAAHKSGFCGRRATRRSKRAEEITRKFPEADFGRNNFR